LEAASIATIYLTAFLVVLLALWIGRWRGWIADSPWLTYMRKAQASINDGDQDWAVRSQNRAHEAQGMRRWTDRVPDSRPPWWLWALTLGAVVASVALRLL
jgi:hypothetical protein